MTICITDATTVTMVRNRMTVLASAVPLGKVEPNEYENEQCMHGRGVLGDNTCPLQHDSPDQNQNKA